ncbi:MAG TPA: hypothetical protein DEQ02_05705 [Ruminococcaceae bacterium]|nr:hypothetical protein [Oscillospiraceae bacterium]
MNTDTGLKTPNNPDSQGGLIKTFLASFTGHPFISSALLCLISYVMFLTVTQGNIEWRRYIFLFAVLGIIFAAALTALCFYLAKTKAFTDKNIILLLFLLGFALRLVVNAAGRQHDIGSFQSGNGHLGYIGHLLENGSLPQGDVREIDQFYHPPLHHILAALWMKLQMILGASLETAAKGIRFLTLFYSTACMVLAYKIFKVLKISGKAMIAAFAIIAFHPTFFILAASMNNDVLSVTFTFGAILAALNWMENRSYRNILLLALCIGLGMMTKLSVWMVAPAVAAMFLIMFIRERQERGSLFRQFCAFGAVCVPLGIWWEVRNYITHGVPPSYVPLIGSDSAQYVGYHSVWNRLFNFDAFQFESVYHQFEFYGGKYYEFNPTIGLLKTAMFDEGNYQSLDFVAKPLFWIGTLLAVCALAVMIYMLIKKTGVINSLQKKFFVIIYGIYFILYYVFCFTHPHTCTENIRYAVPLILMGAIFTGLFLKQAKGARSTPLKTASRVMYVLTTVFAVLSSAMYIFIIML